MKEILTQILEQLKIIAKKDMDNSNYTYMIVKVPIDDDKFSAALAMLGDDGFEFVQIVAKNIGKFEIIVRKKRNKNE